LLNYLEITKTPTRFEKTYEYYYEKYRTKRSEWKVFGDIDIFQVHDVTFKLVNRMTEGLPDNVKLKVTVENRQNDRVNQTKLLSKQDIICRLSDWVNVFIDYYDMEIEDITFKLMAIEIPAGAGRVNNKCQECHGLRNADCLHTDSERAITGLWTTAEMEKALEKGYKIEKKKFTTFGILNSPVRICGKVTLESS
jgi:hypothetical protein